MSLWKVYPMIARNVTLCVYLKLDIFWNIVLFGAHFTDDFLFAIQIPWKIRLVTGAQIATNFLTYTTTAQLSWHVQNFVATLFKN